MSLKYIYNLTSWSITIVVSLSISTAVSAEDKLVKGKAMYLGWAQPDKRFRPCEGAIIDVENGRIERTTDTCEKRLPSDNTVRPVGFEFSGVVQEIKLDSDTLVLKSEEGAIESVYYRPSFVESGQVNLNDLRSGNHITVKGPVPGRADSIITETTK